VKINPIEQAINEQARGFVPADGLENGVKGKSLTKQQICQRRRSIENILVDMADKLRTFEKPGQVKPKKIKRRRRRRGPRVLAVRFDRVQERRCESC
jgi:hypothetical protein